MNELATLDLSQLPSTQIGSDAAYDSLAEGGDFLGYIKLCNSDKYVKKDKIKNGHFGIPKSKEEVIDLGPSIDVLPLARRPKAIDLSDTSAIVTSYDETSDAFKAIVERSTTKDSGCQWGTSFLVLERSTGRFLELYFGTISCRPEAKNVFPALPLTQSDIDRKAKAGAEVSDLEPHGPYPVTVKAGWKENKKGGWYSPVVTKCSTPIKPPASDVVVKQIVKFLTIKNDGAEKVQDTRKERAR
jgi:hypothetical protein